MANTATAGAGSRRKRISKESRSLTKGEHANSRGGKRLRTDGAGKTYKPSLGQASAKNKGGTPTPAKGKNRKAPGSTVTRGQAAAATRASIKYTAAQQKANARRAGTRAGSGSSNGNPAGTLGQGIRDIMGNVVPQDMLYKSLADKLKNMGR